MWQLLVSLLAISSFLAAAMPNAVALHSSQGHQLALQCARASQQAVWPTRWHLLLLGFFIVLNVIQVACYCKHRFCRHSIAAPTTTTPTPVTNHAGAGAVVDRSTQTHATFCDVTELPKSQQIWIPQGASSGTRVKFHLTPDCKRGLARRDKRLDLLHFNMCGHCKAYAKDD